MPTYNKWASIVDEYARGEMESNHYADSIETYRDIVQKVVESLGLDERVDGQIRLRRAAQWIRDVLLPMRRIELKKQRITHAGSK